MSKAPMSGGPGRGVPARERHERFDRQGLPRHDNRDTDAAVVLVCLATAFRAPSGSFGLRVRQALDGSLSGGQHPRSSAGVTVAADWLRRCGCTKGAIHEEDLKQRRLTLDIESHINARHGPHASARRLVALVRACARTDEEIRWDAQVLSQLRNLRQ
jgi:hypothetical protein